MRLKITALLYFTLAAASLSAGSIDYLSNQSADYLRTFCRNASTDADAVHYNPAATSLAEDGIHLYLSSQWIFKNYSSELTASSTAPLGKNDAYESKKPSLFVPNFYGIYKKSNFAVFAGAGVIAGGGSVDYKDGVPLMVIKGVQSGLLFRDGNLKGSVLYYFGSIGGAFAFSDSLSVSAGLRYVNAQKKFEGEGNYVLKSNPAIPYSLKADAEKTAQGVGGIFGLCFKNEKLILSARFETPTILDFETDVSGGKSFGGLFVDGSTQRYDLPAMLGLGASYKFGDLLLTSSLDCFFIGWSDQGDDSDTSDGYDDDYSSVGYEISFAAEYTVIPNFLMLSVGYMYNDAGGNKDTYNDFDYSLDSHSVGIGGRITPAQNLDLVFGLGRIQYVSSKGYAPTSTSGYMEDYKKAVWNFALGLEYKI